MQNLKHFLTKWLFNKSNKGNNNNNNNIYNNINDNNNNNNTIIIITPTTSTSTTAATTTTASSTTTTITTKRDRKNVSTIYLYSFASSVPKKSKISVFGFVYAENDLILCTFIFRVSGKSHCYSVICPQITIKVNPTFFGTEEVSFFKHKYGRGSECLAREFSFR